MALNALMALAAAIVMTVGNTVAPGRATVLPRVGAGAAVLMDAATGQVLWADHAYRQMDPASTTKMMTTYFGR